MSGLLKRGIDFGARCCDRTGFLRLMENCEGSQGKSDILRVLTYHRVDHLAANCDLYPNLISAIPSEFADQMEYLARHCRVISLEELLAAVDAGAKLPPRSVLVTFDDGYRDFAQHAWPVLQRLNLPVTLFVATGFPDQAERAFWWDRLYAALRNTSFSELNVAGRLLPLATAEQRRGAMKHLIAHVKSLPDDEAQASVAEVCEKLSCPPAENAVLSWEELRELAAAGVTLAPHTQLHPLLNRVSVDRAVAEIAGSWEDLRRHCGREIPPAFAYPSGYYSAEIVRELPRLGIRLAFTTQRGVNNLAGMDRWRIRRINIGRRTSPALMRAQMLPWTVYFNRWSPVPGGN